MFSNFDITLINLLKNPKRKNENIILQCPTMDPSMMLNIFTRVHFMKVKYWSQEPGSQVTLTTDASSESIAAVISKIRKSEAKTYV